jgi:hypothetical protein
MIDAGLRQSLAAYDDAALAMLANAGLVRRAHRDVADGKVRLLGGAGGTAEVEVDGQQVTIDTRGPRAAACACKAVGVCRHRIAAVLFLLTADAAPADAAATTAGPAAIAPPAPDDPQDIVAAIALAALERWAGKASWRAALALAASPATVEPQPHAIAVSLDGLAEPVLILRGQGLDGMVSKAGKAQRKAFHAAAMLAARRHFALPIPDLAADLAADSTVEDAAALAIDADFLARIAATLGEVATQGFNLAPIPLADSLFTLSVSSRADSLPRLAALLGGLRMHRTAQK